MIIVFIVISIFISIIFFYDFIKRINRWKKNQTKNE